MRSVVQGKLVVLIISSDEAERLREMLDETEEWPELEEILEEAVYGE